MKQRPLGDNGPAAPIVGLGRLAHPDQPASRPRPASRLGRPYREVLLHPVAVGDRLDRRPTRRHPRLAGARNRAQLSENAQAGALDIEPADIARIRRDVLAPGQPTKEPVP